MSDAEFVNEELEFEVAEEQESELDSEQQAPEKGGERSGRERPRRGVRTVAELEQEGDIAADYLEELLDIVDFGGDIEIDVENDRALVEVVGESTDLRDLEKLVGDDGEVLEAMQELTRLAVQARTGERSRLMLDIAGFRADRREELRNIALEAVTKVETSGNPVKLQPMNPFERKVCHDVVADAGLYSESEGHDASRHVVVYPADPVADYAVKADADTDSDADNEA